MDERLFPSWRAWSEEKCKQCLEHEYEILFRYTFSLVTSFKRLLHACVGF
ncbi:hypothetical protein WH47_02901 [Habropoda laboriosa]|uniref:Uncharacterized protein n=1 Tax=Habropoda laboriosa TaxID=597456 RepID=A0A0L7RHX9_9HYME|nr:hypothetical protein WH47_02901 [Habropoda laboriosa]